MTGGPRIAPAVAHPRVTIALAVLAAVAAILGILRLRSDTSLEAMFARNNPAAVALTHVLNDFPAADQLLVLASLPDSATGPDPARLTAFGERFQAAIERDPKIAAMTDGVIFRPDESSRSFVEKVIGPAAMFYLDDEAFAAARRRLTRPEIDRQIAQDRTLLAAPGPAAEAMSKIIAQDPLRLHEFILDRLTSQRMFRTFGNGETFISPDGRNLLIRVIGTEPPNNLDYCRRLTDGIEAAGRSVNSDGLKLQYAGSYAIAARSAQAIRSDMISGIIGSIVLLQLLFLIACRRPFMLFALAFGPVALGILLGFGAYSIFSSTLTPLTAVLGAILAGMGIDYSIQILAYYESCRTHGAGPKQAAIETSAAMSRAVFAAWATSVVGFVAIGWSRVKVLRDFAIVGTLGLTGAFVCAMALLPVTLMLTDRRSDGSVRSRLRFSAAGAVERLGHGRSVWVSLSIALMIGSIAVIAVAGGNLLRPDPDLTAMHPRPNPAIDAQNDIARAFGISPGSLVVYLHADSPRDLVSLACDADARLRKVSQIGATYGLATLLPDPREAESRAKSVSAADADRVVADFDAALKENGFASKPFEDYAKFLRLLLTRRNVPGVADLIPFRRTAETVLPASAFRGQAPTEAVTLAFARGSVDLDRDRTARDETITAVRHALAGLNGATLTGLSVVSFDTERTVQRELPRLSLIALAIVAAVLAAWLRRPGLTALSLLPTVFGMIVAAAVLHLAGQTLNMVNLVAVPLLIGIDVDYGIFLVAVARLPRAGSSAAERMAPATQAVTMCALATILGYISLIWTSVPAERSLGTAAAVGVGACLVGVLFLLVPILFTLLRRA